MFRRWEEHAAQYVIGGWTRRGVFPTVLVWSLLLTKALGSLPWLVVMAIINAFVVVTLAWGVMPLLTRMLANWLRTEPMTH